MSAVALLPRAVTGWLARLIPTERAIGKLYVWASSLLLLCTIIFPLHLQERLPYNTLPSMPTAFFILLGAVALRGKAVLRITQFDWVMVAWILLTILSQLNAWLNLNRSMFEHEVVSVLFTTFTMWFVFRCFYAFAVINPQAAVRATLTWLAVILGICALIGILQSVGPVQQQMTNLAVRIGVGEENIKMGASEATAGARTTSVFSGPNIFGFVNLIGSSVVIGAAMAYRQKMKEVQGFLVIAALGFFAYANLNSQSRLPFALAAVLGLVYIVYLIRAAKWRALLMAAIMFIVLAIGTVILTSGGGYKYMTSIFETGIVKDVSYQVRVMGFERFARVANDIPVIGVGQDFYTLTMFGRGDFYSNANGAGDNGLVMAYLLMGIPGVIHFFFINFVCFKALRRLKNENKIFIGAIKNVSWLVFWLFVGTIMYSVRYYKFETFSYWLICFGLVFGILAVQENRDRRLREMGMTADDMQPDPA